jgi:hypothetical protein
MLCRKACYHTKYTFHTKMFMSSNKCMTVNIQKHEGNFFLLIIYFNISREMVLQSEICLTKNCHVAHNGTKKCMWRPRGSLKNCVPLYNYTTLILTPFTPPSHLMPTLKLTESTHMSISINTFQSNFSATCILPSSYLFWKGKRLVDYL